MTADSEKLDFAYRYCETQSHQHDSDRYFATLFAPADKRSHLFALYAFNAEVARIQDGIREPMAGEIRLQWWRDALNSGAQEDASASGNPVVTALVDTIRACDLPLPAFQNLIDARTFDLYTEPMPSLNDLKGYCGETCSVLFQLAGMILGGRSVDVSEAAGHGGVAYAVTGLIRAFPWHIRKGKVYIPADVLAQHGVEMEKMTSGEDEVAVRRVLLAMRDIAEDHLGKAMAELSSVPPQARVGLLPLALIRPYLKLLDRRDYQPFETILDLPQWRRQWTLWRAARHFG